MPLGFTDKTKALIKSFEGFVPTKKRNNVAGRLEEDIGYGYMLVDPSGKVLNDRRYWDSGSGTIDLFKESITQEQADKLLVDLWHGRIPGQRPSWDSKLTSYINEGLITNQNQYDALASLTWATGTSEYNGRVGSKLLKKIADVLRKNRANFPAGAQEIKEIWVGGVAPARRLQEYNLFFSNIENSGTLQNSTNSGDGSGDNAQNPGSEDDENGQVDFGTIFKQIDLNTASLEEDNVAYSWGTRNNIEEDSDWIGLKQFILYLVTRYRPQSLVPFVELIPVYSLEVPKSVKNTQSGEIAKKSEQLKLIGKVAGLDDSQMADVIDATVAQKSQELSFLDNDDLIKPDRYTSTIDQLQDLFRQGGTDLLTLDPFQEVTEANSTFNTPNKAEKLLRSNRGYGYKILSALTLNPQVQEGFLSKSGAIGFESFEMENGAESGNNSTMVTIKLKDIQGNKFTDINSPWSFLLNGSSPDAGDFLFRYGWQLGLPIAYVDANGRYKNKDDITAESFWNHEGWKLFTNDTRDTIYNIAKTADWSIMLSQAITPESYRNIGYSYEEKQDGNTKTSQFFFVRDRDLNPSSYMALTMISPEIDVDSNTGAITATMKFRSSNYLANNLAKLRDASWLSNLVNTANNDTMTLEDLMKAYVRDNMDWFNNSLSPKLQKIDKNQVLDPINIDTWLNIVSEKGDNSTQIKASSIKIVISSDAKDAINSAHQSAIDDNTSFKWLQDVLGDNDCKILEAGGSTAGGGNTSGAFTIATSQDVASSNSEPIKESIADITIGGMERLQFTDDVFSFRFQGSLIESLKFEKLTSTTEQQQRLALGIAGEIDKLENGTKHTDDLNKQIEETKSKNEEAQKEGKGLTTLDLSANFLNRNEKTISLAQRKGYLIALLAQMMKVEVEGICHPWIQLGKFVYVKGTGFFDGKYLVKKFKHMLSQDNKFTSSFTLIRTINNNDLFKKQVNQAKQVDIAQNKTGVGIGQPVHRTLSKSQIQNIKPPSGSGTNQISTANAGNSAVSTSNANISKADTYGKRLAIIATDEYDKKVVEYDINVQAYITFTAGSFSQIPWCASFVSWCLYQAVSLTSANTDVPKTTSSMSILDYYINRNKFAGKDSGYIPKPGDLAIWKRGDNIDQGHIGIVAQGQSGKFITIEGNSGNRIKKNNHTAPYNSGTNEFLGWCLVF